MSEKELREKFKDEIEYCIGCLQSDFEAECHVFQDEEFKEKHKDEYFKKIQQLIGQSLYLLRNQEEVTPKQIYDACIYLETFYKIAISEFQNVDYFTATETPLPDDKFMSDFSKKIEYGIYDNFIKTSCQMQSTIRSLCKKLLAQQEILDGCINGVLKIKNKTID